MAIMLTFVVQGNNTKPMITGEIKNRIDSIWDINNAMSLFKEKYLS